MMNDTSASVRELFVIGLVALSDTPAGLLYNSK